MALIPEQVLDILQSRTLAHLATIGPGGAPHNSGVWFGWDGARLFFIMKKGRQKYRNLVRDPRVAISIVDPTNLYRSLEIRGRVRIEDDRDYRFLNEVSRKYLERDATPEEAGAPEERAVLFVEPERVFVFPPSSEQQRGESA